MLWLFWNWVLLLQYFEKYIYIYIIYVTIKNIKIILIDISSFQAFFNYIDMRVLLENFCVYHVNAPGQEEGAPTLPEEWVNFLNDE